MAAPLTAALWQGGGWLADATFAVTGGGSGIGGAVVAHLVAAGARGIAMDIRAPETKLPGADFFRADVASLEDWDRAAAHVRDELGGLDVLVNAAGIQYAAPVDRAAPELVERVLSINLLGVLNGARAMSPLLAERRGSLVNIASSLGRVGAPDQTAYSASKGGVIALTRSLAAELGPAGVRANCVCPGPVGTELFWKNARESAEDPGADDATLAEPFASKTPLNRIATVDEIAAVVVFLASSAAGYITGASIAVDGGKTAI